MTKAEKIITENFDLLTSVVQAKSSNGRGVKGGIDSYGIKKLRRLILKFATEGLLTEQDSKDECASVQLKRMWQAEMEYKKTKQRQKSVASTILGQEANSLPSGWAITTLDSLVTVLNGRAYKKDELLNSGTPVLRVGNLFTSSQWYYSDLILEDDKYCQSGDLIFAWSASFGPFIWEGPKAIFHYHIWKLLPHKEDDISKHFLLLVLQEKTEGIKNEGHGVAMLHMTKAKMEKLSIRLPPLAEQKRIVEKVEELMRLCDQLEKDQNNTIETHNTLITTLLKSLSSKTTNETEFAITWQTIRENFDMLFTTESSIKKLKQTIIQLAVMGKLVPQNTEDESANELLKKIDVAKAKFIKEKKIKKQKPLPKISKKEAPYSLPNKWEWIRLGDATNYGITKKIEATEVEKEIWVLELEDIEKITSKLLKKVRFNERQFKSSKNIFNKSDVIYGKLRPYLDKVVIADEPGVCTTEMIPLKGYAGILPEYLRWVMKSPYFTQYANDSTHGMNLPRMGTEKARLALIPLPPKEEQYRIVAKVDELMALCDQLKSSLAIAQTTQLKLADNIVEEAIG